MRVQIDLGLDLHGNHTFAWQRAEGLAGIEVPRTTVERWAQEWDSFKLAYLRWQRVVDEIDDHLYRAQPPAAERAVAVLRAASRRRRSPST